MVLLSGSGGRAGSPPLTLQESVRLRVTLIQRHGKLRAGERVLTKFSEYRDAANRNSFFFLLSQFKWIFLSLLTHNVMAISALIWAGFPRRPPMGMLHCPRADGALRKQGLPPSCPANVPVCLRWTNLLSDQPPWLHTQSGQAWVPVDSKDQKCLVSLPESHGGTGQWENKS